MEPFHSGAALGIRCPGREIEDIVTKQPRFGIALLQILLQRSVAGLTEEAFASHCQRVATCRSFQLRPSPPILPPRLPLLLLPGLRAAEG